MVLDLATIGEVTIAVRPDRTAIVPTRTTHPAHGCTTFAITMDSKLADEFGRRYMHLVETFAAELAVRGAARTKDGVPTIDPKKVKRGGVDWTAFGGPRTEEMTPEGWAGRESPEQVDERG